MRPLAGPAPMLDSCGMAASDENPKTLASLWLKSKPSRPSTAIVAPNRLALGGAQMGLLFATVPAAEPPIAPTPPQAS